MSATTGSAVALTRDEKIAEAKRLSTEQGLSSRQIAARLGVAQSTIVGWLDPEGEKRRDAADSARRGPAKRAWEDEHDRPVCPCGNRCGAGAHRRPGARGVCAACWREMRAVECEWRRQPLYDLWHAGASIREIAAELGWSTGAVRFHVSTMRAGGWDMPYRYGGYGTR